MELGNGLKCSLIGIEDLLIDRYVTQRTRDPEKRGILLDLAEERARMAEEDDYLRVGFRRRRVKL